MFSAIYAAPAPPGTTVSFPNINTAPDLDAWTQKILKIHTNPSQRRFSPTHWTPTGQTNRQADGLERPTHADRQSGVGNEEMDDYDDDYDNDTELLLQDRASCVSSSSSFILFIRKCT